MLNVNLFDQPPVKNRRFTADEYRDELYLAKAFCRPPCSYILDKPFYPYVPTNEKYMVNFDLNPPQ